MALSACLSAASASCCAFQLVAERHRFILADPLSKEMLRAFVSDHAISRKPCHDEWIAAPASSATQS
jgi:hypothetical protein